ncbi:MAG: sugar transferase [Pseudomonadota bacterium]
MTDTAAQDPVHSIAADPVLPWRGLYVHVFKRAVDVLICSVLAAPALVLILVFYLLVRLDGGPGFFGHLRTGRAGRSFRCWKIRTMVPDAEQKLIAHLATNQDASAEWARDRKLREDPRVTWLGRMLRASSLDELPQLWNVLRGDMSLIGPRPVTRDELAKYGSGQSAYLAMRPGITGLWQVSGRNDITYDERVRLDVVYQQTLSLRLDFAILLRTIKVLLSRSGF